MFLKFYLKFKKRENYEYHTDAYLCKKRKSIMYKSTFLLLHTTLKILNKTQKMSKVFLAKTNYYCAMSDPFFLSLMREEKNNINFDSM